MQIHLLDWLELLLFIKPFLVDLLEICDLIVSPFGDLVLRLVLRTGFSNLSLSMLNLSLMPISSSLISFVLILLTFILVSLFLRIILSDSDPSTAVAITIVKGRHSHIMLELIIQEKWFVMSSHCDISCYSAILHHSGCIWIVYKNHMTTSSSVSGFFFFNFSNFDSSSSLAIDIIKELFSILFLNFNWLCIVKYLC